MGKNDISGKIEDMLRSYLEENALSIYKIDYKKVGKDWNLDVYLDKAEGSEEEFVNVDECELVNRFLSDELDKVDIIPHQYTLSVSSAGLDRELIREADFKKYAGRMVEVRLYEQLEGRKQFEGILEKLENGIVTITVIDNNKEKNLEIERAKIAKINLAVVF